MPSALFDRDGDLFVPTSLSGSPWREGFLHGGPVCGLAAHAAARRGAGGDRVPSRLCVDLHSPVPMSPLRVRAAVARESRRIALVEVSIEAEQREVARATALFLAATDTAEHEPAGRPLEPPHGPGGLVSTTVVPPAVAARFPPGFHREAEVRWASPPGSAAPAAWIRMPMPLISTETLTAFEHVATISDLANAIASVTQRSGRHSAVAYINPETTLYLTREPEGEWIGLSLDSLAEDRGVGLAEVALFDTHGVLGRVMSARLANPRS